MILASQANHSGSNPGIRITLSIEVVNLGKKESVNVGDRIQLISIDDTWTKIKAGDKGIVVEIEKEQDLIWVKWDNGERLALIDGVDKFKVVKK